LTDGTRPPNDDDGIVFGPLVEGQPGMQPERLPPYSTRFNPGYDPKLKEFETTPVFEAVKAAYNPAGPVPCQWDHVTKSPLLPAPTACCHKGGRFRGQFGGLFETSFGQNWRGG
jgi:hypothetical protein